MDTYTGSPGDEFTMLSEKQKLCACGSRTTRGPTKSTSWVAPALVSRHSWRMRTGMLLAWLFFVLETDSSALRAEMWKWHQWDRSPYVALSLKDQSTVRALPAANDKWASSFVRGVHKAFKLKLDLEIPRACGSPVVGGEIFKSHMDKVNVLVVNSLCDDYSVNFISKIFSKNYSIFQFFVIFFLLGWRGAARLDRAHLPI